MSVYHPSKLFEKPGSPEIERCLQNGTIDEMATEILNLLFSAVRRELQEGLDEANRNGFLADFKRSEVILTHFCEHVKNVVNTFNAAPDKYYGLYFSIVQSSGYGKSRILIECCKRNFLNVAYMCLRDEKESGFPHSTQHHKDQTKKSLFSFLQSINEVEKLQVFIALTYRLCKELRGKKAKLYDFAGADFSFSALWDQVIDLFLKTQPTEYEAILKKFTDLQASLDRTTPELLIVFDEARVLLESISETSKSIFRNLRRAQFGLRSRSLVLVFIDTLSTVSHFSPAKKFDTSGRRDQVDYDLLPPFYEILSYDSFIINCGSTDYNRTNMEELAETFSHGRPLWTALFFKENIFTDPFFYGAIVFACRKLACSTFLIKTKLNESLLKSIEINAASMSIRYGIRGILDHYLALNLMKAHLGTGKSLLYMQSVTNLGIYLAEDRVRMTVVYPPEPIVAEAACQFLEIDNEHLNISQFIDQLDRFWALCLNGLVSAGEVGEFLARFCISFCYDRAVMKRKLVFNMSGVSHDAPINSALLYSSPLLLKEFLVHLLPKAEFDATPISTKLLDAEVCFTNWAHLEQLEHDEPQFDSYLRECFNTRTAVIMPQGHPGADLLIPIRFRASKNDENHSYSYILFQVKNRKKVQACDRRSFAGENLRPMNVLGLTNSKSEYLSIYFETSRSEDNIEVGSIDGLAEFRQKFGQHRFLVGFSSCPALNEFPEIIDSLRMHHHYHVQYADLYRRPFKTLNTMAPHLFRFAYHSCNCSMGCKSNICGCKKVGIKCSGKCHEDDTSKKCENK